MKSTYWIFIILLLSGLVNCAPVLQIKDFSVYPEKAYPGTEGQIQLTLSNSGDDMASGVSIYYDYSPGDRWSVYVGDIGENSEAITSVPFKVPDRTDTGVVLVELTMYYNNEDGTNLKTSKASIPVSISQHQIMEIRTIGLSKDIIRSGDPIEAEIEITNTGGVMDNVIIKTDEESPFSLVGTTSQRVGNIEAGESIQTTVGIISSSSADDGKHTIPLVITYNDAQQNEVSQTFSIGPITVMDSSSIFRITGEALSDSEIGSELEYKISIQNRGGSVQSAVLVIDANDVFTPIGSNTVYFDSLQPDETRSETISLGIDASASSGYYALPLTLKVNGEEIEYETGIVVEATPEIVLTTESSSSTTGQAETTIRIANSGNTPIRAVYVHAEETEGIKLVGDDEKFIGTLNVDDFASFQITAEGQGRLPIVLEFKDNDNKKHTITSYIDIEGGAFGSLQTGNAQYAGPRSQGINPLFLGAGGLVLAAGLYFVYRKWRKKQ